MGASCSRIMPLPLPHGHRRRRRCFSVLYSSRGDARQMQRQRSNTGTAFSCGQLTLQTLGLMHSSLPPAHAPMPPFMLTEKRQNLSRAPVQAGTALY